MLGPTGKKNFVVAFVIKHTYLPSDKIMCLVTPGGPGT